MDKQIKWGRNGYIPAPHKNDVVRINQIAPWCWAIAVLTGIVYWFM